MAFPVETKFLGLDPLAVLEDVYNAMDDYVSDSVDALETALMNTVGSAPTRIASADSSRQQEIAHRTSEIRDGTDELHHALRAHLDRNFDKFELYALKNVLKVPDSVAKQLDDVEQQSRHSAASFTDFTATEEEEARLRDSISALQSAVIEQRARRRALLTMKAHAESKLPQCEQVIAQVEATVAAFLSATPQGTPFAIRDVVHSSLRLETAVSHLKSTFLTS